MVTIFTEDGRTLQYDDTEEVFLIDFFSEYRRTGDLTIRKKEVLRIHPGDNIVIQGLGSRRDREHDVAMVREIAKPTDSTYKAWSAAKRVCVSSKT
jgi:uncharacterized protein YifE (UPF0438 family)